MRPLAWIAEGKKAAQGRPQAFIFHWQPRDKMFDNITASFQHETLTAEDGRRITRYAHGAVFFHWRRDPADAVYVCQARRWQAYGEAAPWNWRLVPPPPAPPLAAIRMITADYQGGGEYDIRATAWDGEKAIRAQNPSGAGRGGAGRVPMR